MLLLLAGCTEGRHSYAPWIPLGSACTSAEPAPAPDPTGLAAGEGVASIDWVNDGEFHQTTHHRGPARLDTNLNLRDGPVWAPSSTSTASSTPVVDGHVLGTLDGTLITDFDELTVEDEPVWTATITTLAFRVPVP